MLSCQKQSWASHPSRVLSLPGTNLLPLRTEALCVTPGAATPASHQHPVRLHPVVCGTHPRDLSVLLEQHLQPHHRGQGLGKSPLPLWSPVLLQVGSPWLGRPLCKGASKCRIPPVLAPAAFRPSQTQWGREHAAGPSAAVTNTPWPAARGGRAHCFSGGLAAQAGREGSWGAPLLPSPGLFVPRPHSFPNLGASISITERGGDTHCQTFCF